MVRANVIGIAILFAFFALPAGFTYWVLRAAGLPNWQSALAAATLTALVWLFLWWRFGRNKTRYNFENEIRIAIVALENGGYLQIKHQKSPWNVRVCRSGGDDTCAEILVSVPDAPWARKSLSCIVQLFENHDVSFATNDLYSRHSLIEARLHTANIWDEAVGAPGARLLHLLLDLFGVGTEELFNISFEGERSLRTAGDSRELHRGES